MDSCKTESHSFVYIDRSDYDMYEPFMEYYICIDCGDTQIIEHYPGKFYKTGLDRIETNSLVEVTADE